MAKKTVPAALQAEISNNEDWEKLLQKPGLIVVDVYSEWSGPCTGMVSILKKIKMEIGGDALSYATSDYVLPENHKNLLLDGKCMFMRLKITEDNSEVDIHEHLMNLLFGEPELPNADKVFTEECFAGRHRPAFVPPENEEIFPIAWTPPNPRNKAIVYRTIFPTYTAKTYPYEDKSSNVPTVLFKYDYTRKNELKIVMEEFEDEVVNFGIFEADKPPEAKIIARSIDEFEESTRERTGYETFVCVVKKVGCEAFLGFAGIGPYHVSDSPEKGSEESKLYFPDITGLEETQSDDDEKPEENAENPENGEENANNEPA